MSTLSELNNVRDAYRAFAFYLIDTETPGAQRIADLLGMADDLVDAVEAGTISPYAVGLTVGYLAAASVGRLDPTITGALVDRPRATTPPPAEADLRAAFVAVTPLPGAATTDPADIDRIRNAEMRHAFAVMDAGGTTYRPDERVTLLDEIAGGLRAGTVSAYAVGATVGIRAFGTGCALVDAAGTLDRVVTYPASPPVAVAAGGMQAAVLAVTPSA